MQLGAFTYNALRTVQGDKVNVAAGGQNWGKFKEKMKELRQGKKGKKDSGKSAKDLETIVVQRLSAEVSGKAQKYSRIGAREFVPFEQFDEISVCNIKKACMKHYGMPETMSCDVLAGEQGPSCSSVKQLPTLKVIHVRFIEGKVEDAPIEVSAGVSERRKRKISKISQGQKAAAVTSVPQRASQSPSKFVPRSLSVVDMLKLGKLITNTTTSVEIFNFDMSGMAWTGRPSTVEFSIEPEPFGTGGFRKAFKATSNDRGFNGSTWVVKKYLKKAADDIITIGQTIEEQTKKVVQMHYLARNFAAKLKEELLASDNEILFGETMSYKKIFMGKIGEEYVTVEEFVEGTFRKYINNNGNICESENADPLTKKAECLAHFSYERSEREVMLLDIQGCGSCLFDPEIASKVLEPSNMLFCTGNLSKNAIENFTANHKCNDYCHLLQLTEFE